MTQKKNSFFCSLRFGNCKEQKSENGRGREVLCGYSKKNAKKVEEYIKRQLKENKAGERLIMGNF